VRKVGDVLPAEVCENESTVARAAGRLSSRPLGGQSLRLAAGIVRLSAIPYDSSRSGKMVGILASYPVYHHCDAHGKPGSNRGRKEVLVDPMCCGVTVSRQ